VIDKSVSEDDGLVLIIRCLSFHETKIGPIKDGSLTYDVIYESCTQNVFERRMINTKD
jgi:hypothetical protein